MWLPGLAALSWSSWAVWKGRGKAWSSEDPGLLVGCLWWESNQAILEKEPANRKVLNDLRPSPLFWAKEPRSLLWRAVG